jgi:hypothetical protein
VVVLFQAASLYHAERLRSSCVKFILRSYDKLEKEGVLEQLSEDVVEELNLLKEIMNADKAFKDQLAFSRDLSALAEPSAPPATTS